LTGIKQTYRHDRAIKYNSLVQRLTLATKTEKYFGEYDNVRKLCEERRRQRAQENIYTT